MDRVANPIENTIRYCCYECNDGLAAGNLPESNGMRLRVWNEGAIKKIWERILAERNFDLLCILGDALEDAGYMGKALNLFRVSNFTGVINGNTIKGLVDFDDVLSIALGYNDRKEAIQGFLKCLFDYERRNDGQTLFHFPAKGEFEKVIKALNVKL